MNEQNQVLTRAVILISQTLAGIIETQTILGRVSIPLTQNLTDQEKTVLTERFEHGPEFATKMREMAALVEACSPVPNVNEKPVGTIEELTAAVVYFSNIVAGLLEMNANMARVVVPLAENLSEEQKIEVSGMYAEVPQLAASIRAISKQFGGQADGVK